MRKRTEIEIEFDEVTVISTRHVDIPELSCPICADRVMVTPEGAAAITGVSVRIIYARVESDSVHFLETSDGLLLLCANSLSRRADGLKELAGATNPDAQTQMENE